MIYRCRGLVLAALVYLATASFVVAAQEPTPSSEPNFTEAQKEDFLRNAKVVATHSIGKGVTHPSRLTLSDGTVTHDAAFQPVDEHKPVMQFSDGRTELNFIDSYRYNIAGYELSKLLGMDDTQIPPTVKRSWHGQDGALAWWIPWKWDEVMRTQQNVHPPDIDAWNQQMYRIRVFDELVYDTDPNLTNVLITADWKVWRIDFTRAFRLFNDLRDPKDLVMCDRKLLEKLRQLDANTVLEKTKPFLTKSEVKALMARRDKIVKSFDKMVAEKGEAAVLY
jgi:hypothetical protein